MQKQEFIKKLKRELQWHLSSAELRRVMQEYEGYFTAACGGNADTVIAELGDPALVAAEILSEHPTGSVRLKYEKARITVAFILLLIAVIIYILFPVGFQYRNRTIDGFYYSIDGILHTINLLVLLPTTLVLLLGLGRKECSERGKTDWLFGLNIVIIALIWGAWYFAFFQPLLSLMYSSEIAQAHWLFWDIPVNNIGPVFELMVKLIGLLTVGLIVGAGRQIIHNHLIFIPLIYLNCSTLCGLYKYLLMLHMMDDPASLPGVLGGIMQDVSIGVLISAAVALLLFLRRRLVKA